MGYLPPLSDVEERVSISVLYVFVIVILADIAVNGPSFYTTPQRRRPHQRGRGRRRPRGRTYQQRPHKGHPRRLPETRRLRPGQAIWVTPRLGDLHTILEGLHDAALIEKTYADTTEPENITITTPGLTTIHTYATTTDQLQPTD